MIIIYSSQSVLLKHKQRYNQQEITSIKASKESRLYWKNPTQKNPLFFRRHADFTAGNEVDNSSTVKKNN